MPQIKRQNQSAKISPLWVITAFLTFTEVIAGIAITKATGGVQIALTAFVVAFPLLVSTAFFVILWHRPFVLYPPSDYSGVDVGRFVDAMQRRQSDEKKTLALVQETMFSAASTPETKRFANSAIQRLNDSLIFIELDVINGRKGDVYVAPFVPERAVHELLDDVWVSISDFVPSYTFGSVWALQEVETNHVYSDLGRRWARKHRMKEDTRTLKEVGLRPGIKLRAIRLGEFKATDSDQTAT